MKKNTWLTWSLISILFAFAACLPFDHTCTIGTEGDSQGPEAQPQYATDSAAAHNTPTGSHGLREQVRPGKSEVCPACLYSRSLLRTDSTPEVAVARAVAAARACSPVLPLRLTDFFQSTLKRGPPAAQLS